MKHILEKKNHMRMLVPDTTGCQIKTPVPDVKYLPLRFCSGVSQRHPQIIQAVAYAAPELDGKTILLKTPHSLVTGHGEVKLVLSRDTLSHELAFIVLGSAGKAANG